MKQLIFILFVFTLVGCNQNDERNKLIGTWDVISFIDIETGKEEFSKNDNQEFVIIKSDSIYLSSDIVFGWKKMRDSIILNDINGSGSVYIKELTSDKLVIEYDFEFWGNNKLTLEKRK